MQPLDFPSPVRIVLLTGAGVSVASGIRPYRGPGGLWSEVDVNAYVTAAAIARDPRGCFRMHRSFAALARARPPGHVTVITQNVDGLYQRAGAPRVVELHGSLTRLRCPDEACEGRAPAQDPLEGADEAPPCPRCGAPMRYDIVLFDEYLDAADERAARAALRECNVFLAVGTSGVVFPAASYVREADYAGAPTIFVNVEAPSPPNPYFDEVLLGRAEELLPVLLGAS